MNNSDSDKKRYNRIKLILSLTGSAISIAFIAYIAFSGMSQSLSRYVASFSDNIYIQLTLFIGVIGVMESILTFPLNYYSGFRLEHKFGLSNLTLSGWLWENTKGLAVGITMVTPLLLVFYYCLNAFQEHWWLPVAVVFFLFSVLLARVAPTLIFPLFYSFKPITNVSLRDKLTRLTSAVNLSVAGVFEFNMSKTTKKANAAFAGIGRSKRIILADTLLENFSEEEIETVFAHEVGHYYYGHITKSLLLSIITIFGGLYAAARIYSYLLPHFGFNYVTDLAALPLLGIVLTVFGIVTTPIQNALSRLYERQADAYALKATGNKEAFIGAMKRLSEMNMADDEPHPLVEFLFYSHPAISKRIRAAETFHG